MPANEKVARSVALEQAYVHDVYEQFSENPRNKPWPRVQQFLEDLERGSIICDVGCGNGKYLSTNMSIFNIGGDKSSRLCETAREKDHEVIILDNLKLPFRDESLDAALSIAVIHHLATTERRIRALRELARVLRIGGRIIITVWAMEQSHRKFESQDVLVPWHRPQQLSTPSLELISTTTSDEEFPPAYHAYTQSDTDSNRSTKDKGGTVKKKGKTRHKGRSIDPGTSPSSSSLSSPNETCYSFVRRAIQKLAGGRRGSHRPWFLDGWSSSNKDSSARQFEDGHCNCCDCDDIQNLPIELRRVDDEELPQRRQTFPSSQLISDIYSNLKSRSLTDIKTVENNNIVRSKSSVPSIQEAIQAEEENENASQSNTLTKPKLVKQKQSICDDEAEEDLDKPTDMKSLINTLPDFSACSNLKSRGNVLKQRSMNEELMSVERFRENERVKQNIQKQASLNDDLIYRRHRKLDYLKDSFFSVSTSKKFQLLKTGFQRKIKSSTSNIERVTSSSLRNGFVRMFQKWNTVEVVSPTIPEDETVNSPGVVTGAASEERKDNGVTPPERRQSKEDGSDSSKDSSLQSDTSVDSEDSFASVIFVPKADCTSPISLSPSVPTSPRVNSTSIPNSPRIKQSSCPTSPRIKQTPLSVYPLTKQLSSPRPTTSTIKSLFDIPVTSASVDKIDMDQTNPASQTLAQKYSVPQIPKFRKTSLNSEPNTAASELISLDAKCTKKDRLKNIKDLLMQKAESGLRSVRSNYPIVRRTSMSNGNYNILARPLPKLLSLELFNPETDDKDSDSSAVSSPDSVESVVENKTKTNRHSKFSFTPTDVKQASSKTLLEAAANVANSLDEAVEKVIKSSKSKQQSLKSSDVVSVIYRQFDTDVDPLLREDETIDKDDWDVECQKHLTDFADKLSEKLLKEIDQYRENINDSDVAASNASNECVSDQYINRLSEELNDLSKLTEEIQKQNEYLTKLSLRDNVYNSLYCDNCKAMFCNCSNKNKQNLKTHSDDKATTCDSNSSIKMCDISKSTTDESLKSSSKSEPRTNETSDSTAIAQCRTVSKNAFKKGASVESCESEKGSSSNSVISSIATSVHFGLSTESTDGISDRGSSDSQKETSSISKYSDYGSTASLISCPDWSTIRNKIPEERVSFNDKLEIRDDTGAAEKSSLPSLSDTSQESLPSDNIGGAITYHRYYHVFKEGELDQLIEKYVHNLHIISSYYDHASWCVVAEKVQVWTI